MAAPVHQVKELQVTSNPPHFKPSLWGLRKSSFRRLRASIDIARIDLQVRAGRDPARAVEWKAAADRALNRSDQLLQEMDIEGGWGALHCALRYAIAGLTPEELQNQRIQLLNEAVKLTNWRSESIRQILGSEPSKATLPNISDAMAIRDEFSATQYHKIWMTGTQVRLLLIICALASSAYIILNAWLGPLLLSGEAASSLTWNYRSISAALLLGLLGAALSALRGLVNIGQTTRIPERVANHFTTIARLLSGVIAGLAGYVFW